MSRPEPTDLRERRRAFTAGEIERVAVDLFAARGFGEVTVDDIANAAGISPRTFFRYFPTKADVVRAHQDRLFQRLVRALRARPASEGPVTALREAFRATTQMRSEDRERIVLIGRLLATTDGWLAGDVGFDVDRTGELVELVAHHAGVDARRDLRPAVIVASMLGTAQAAFRAWLERDGRVELTRLLDEAFDVLDQGLCALDRSSQPRPRRASTGG
jgi:AcrR family transcriptional regulator